jgi:hypothetical protein
MLPQSSLLLVARNIGLSDNRLLTEGIRALAPRLPPGWMFGALKLHSSDDIDATVELTAPDGRSCQLLLEAKARLAPKQVQPLLYVTAEARERAPLIVVARYLSEGTRQRLRDGGVGYLDLTGNIQIAVSHVLNLEPLLRLGGTACLRKALPTNLLFMDRHALPGSTPRIPES